MLGRTKLTYVLSNDAFKSHFVKQSIAAFISLLISITCSAQDPLKKEIDLNQFIQDFFPIPSDDGDYGDLYESLFQLYADPLDLNTVEWDALSATYILSESQLKSFFEYRNTLGPLLSLYELQAIPGFDLPAIQRLLPFVTVNARSPSIRSAVKNPTQHFLMWRAGRQIEKPKGFKPEEGNTARYQGSILEQYIRYRKARAGIFSVGFTLEKDAGEKIWRWSAGKQIFGFDYTSFHVQVMNRKRLKNLVVGDYQFQAGQGITAGAGFSLGKGSEVINTTYRSTLGIKPYTSATEANFFRGAAATFSITKTAEFTAAFSGVKRDATQDPDKITSSLPASGYHRTSSERDKHHILAERNLAIHFSQKLSAQKGQAGLVMLYTSYDSRIQKRDLPYNKYEFAGRSNITASAYFDRRLQNIHAYGEAGVSRSGGAAAIAGIISSISKKMDLCAQIRHYDKDFHTFYGNANSESSKPVNESGAYLGLRYSPVRKIQLSGYFDCFRFPWLKYQVDAPSRGFDFYLHALWKPNKRINTYAMFHQKQKQRNEPGSKEEFAPLVTTVKRTAMVHFEYDYPMRFSVKTRFQCGNFNYRNISKSFGLAAVQDVTWLISKFELSGRFAYFNTDDYDSRQYVYEKDVLYAFSIPSYYDTGNRHYVMIKYKALTKMTIWLRWSQTRYKELEKISSGLNEIAGNKKSEMKAQVIYQF